MKEIVKRKLDQIDELYPKQRLEKSRERLTRLWKGLPPLDRLPFVASPVSINPWDPSADKEYRLLEHLDEFISRGMFQDDYVPAFMSPCRQSTIPSMFGAREILTGGDYSCEKIIHSAKDAETLPEAKLTPDVMAHQWIEMEEYFIDETEGRIPAHFVDMQGPADVAGKLWGYEDLFMAAYSEPDVYHALLRKTADAYILFCDAQKKAIGDELFIGTHINPFDWVPPDIGVAVSVDSMVMVSPEFFEEFYTPHLARIAERYGGVTIHACGNYTNVVSAINNIPQIKGVHTSQMVPKDLIDAGLSRDITIIGMDGDYMSSFGFIKDEKRKLVPHVYPWPNGDLARKPYLWGCPEWGYIKDYEEKVLAAAKV